MDLWAGVGNFEWNGAWRGPEYEPTAADEALGAALAELHLGLARNNGSLPYPALGDDDDDDATAGSSGATLLVQEDGAVAVKAAYHREQCVLFDEAGVTPRYSWRN